MMVITENGKVTVERLTRATGQKSFKEIQQLVTQNHITGGNNYK
jgi:hypothetical protein